MSLLDGPGDATITSWHIPAWIVTQWPTPNTVNPERRRGLEPLTIVLLLIATGFVAARVYARVTERAGRFGWDDGLIIAAWMFGVVSAVFTIYGVVYAGFDRHIWDALEDGRTAGITVWCQEIFFILSTGLTKISVLVFYRRLFFTAEKQKRRWLLEFPIFLLMVYIVGVIFFIAFSCKPASAYWDSMDVNYDKPYSCIDRHVFDPVKGSLSVIGDAYALLLPQFLIWRLKLQTESRWRLTILFGCGWIATGAGIARTVWLSRLFTNPLRDLTWVAYHVHAWSQVEMQLSIVCASVPAAITFKHRKSSTTATAQRPSSMGSNGSAPSTWSQLEKVARVRAGQTGEPV